MLGTDGWTDREMGVMHNAARGGSIIIWTRTHISEHISAHMKKQNVKIFTLAMNADQQQELYLRYRCD